VGKKVGRIIDRFPFRKHRRIKINTSASYLALSVLGWSKRITVWSVDNFLTPTDTVSIRITDLHQRPYRFWRKNNDETLLTGACNSEENDVCTVQEPAVDENTRRSSTPRTTTISRWKFGEPIAFRFLPSRAENTNGNNYSRCPSG